VARPLCPRRAEGQSFVPQVARGLNESTGKKLTGAVLILEIYEIYGAMEPEYLYLVEGIINSIIIAEGSN